MKQNNIIQLLLVNHSENDAVETSNALRNSGLTLRPKIISSAELFAKEIHKKNYDIILFTDNIAELDVSIALDTIKTAQSDAVFILLGDKTAEETLELMTLGVSSVIPEDPEELTGLIIKKEFEALKGLRSKQVLSKQLEDSETRCQQLIDSSRDAIAYIHEGMHILSNDPYYQMFGYESRDDIEAMPVMDLVSSEDSAQLKDWLRRYSESNKTKSVDEESSENTLKVHGVKDDGTEFQIKMEFQPASMSGEECIQIIIRNDGINKKAQEKLQAKLATLNNQCQETGLYNRRYFLERLEEIVEDAIDNDKQAYLFYITLDKFIEIKEKLGDINSDKLIANLAGLLKSTAGDKVFLARYESYRFTAIFQTDKQQEALQTAENLRKTIDDYIADVSDKSITTTCSIGVLEINSSSNGAQSSLTYVQKACATAIEQGGNQVYQHIPDASEMSNKELLKYWENEIDNAIKQQRMFLVFQPFVNLLGEGSENFELFIRLRNEQGDIIFPREFLPAAEATNHSIHIDRWIIAEAMRILSERVKAGHNNRFIIKLTSASLSDDKFLAWVKHNLERYELKADSVIFQVKAHQAAENLRQTQQLSKQLQQIGSHFSLEHFGKEENAFTLLKHVKVDFLKLDIELVKDISTNADKLVALNEVCAQANEFKVKTIVPFVEEASSLSVIWQSGAHFIQGIFLQEASESLDFDFSSFS
ncbi:MAG: EAL domain-containing protein [Gammaproteobacteria bacterium]|nr:EAL domain-containing protein [Gammaproteobacteria bacterium]